MQRWWPWEPRVPWRTAPSPPPTCCRHAAACVFSCPARALPDRSALLPAVTHIQDRGQRSDRTTPAFSLLETMKLHSQRSDWVLNGNCFHLRLFTCREQKPVGRWRHCCRWVRLTGIPSAMARIAALCQTLQLLQRQASRHHRSQPRTQLESLTDLPPQNVEATCDSEPKRHVRKSPRATMA